MLQTFTYSTGLALTGRSAACAPATATTPAAEPRRRLFTIFISTSKFRCGRVPSPPGAAHPWKVPLVPEQSRPPRLQHLRCPRASVGTNRGCPPQLRTQPEPGSSIPQQKDVEIASKCIESISMCKLYQE